jgi:hypothetical protein
MTLLLDPPHGLLPPQRSTEPMTRRLGLARLRNVGLDELIAQAALTERTDRKYIVTASTARALVDAIGDTHRLLKIKGRQYTSYQTMYFDTPDLTSVSAHIQRRRRRWKVRSRLYVEDDLCRVEVKSKDNTGATLKVMHDSESSRFGTLVEDDRSFVADHLVGYRDADVDTLIPSAEIDYVRATLSDLDAGTRVTIDWNLTMRTPMGATWLDADHVMVETKSTGDSSRPDQVLGELGIRPRRFSKYVAATSTTYPRIPDNDFRRLLTRGVLETRFGPEAPQLMGLPSSR